LAEYQTLNHDNLVQAKVQKVLDGDTLKLTDGRAVRLLGLNAPELGKAGEKSEPYARKAYRKLNSLVHNKTIYLKTDAESADKYSRLLAHVFLADKTNVTAEILKTGLAYLLIIQPNVEFADCYKTAQNTAIEKNLNLFNDAYNLKFSKKSGLIKKYKFTKNSLWLYLDKKKYVRISRDDLKYFAKICWQCLIGKTASFQGWWKKSRTGLRLRLYHPYMMEVDDD